MRRPSSVRAPYPGVVTSSGRYQDTRSPLASGVTIPDEYRRTVRAVAIVLAVLSVLALGWANVSPVTVRQDGPDLKCGLSAQVALYGKPDLPPDTPRPYLSRRACEQLAIQRLVGWGLVGWALLGGALLVPRRQRAEAMPAETTGEHLALDLRR